MTPALKTLIALAALHLTAACSDDNLPAFATGQGDAGVRDESDASTKLDFKRFDDALEAAIAKYNQGAADDAQIAGASAVVVHEKLGTVHTRGYGKFDEDRLYLIASSSKILSVGVLMRLADEGKLDLDKPISTYLKDWGDTKASSITVAQLVSNSSGLPSLTEVVAAASDTSSPYQSNLCQYTEQGKLQDCGKLLYATDPPRKPDSEFAYGGSQWQLAGAVAEVVSGKSWAELIDETYVKPCDVPSLGFTNQFGMSAGFGYPTFFKADKANLPDTENPSIEGGAYVTAPDYGKLLTMHLRGGTCDGTRVLSEKATQRMQQNRIKAYGGTTGSEDMSGYGLGWWVNEEAHVVSDAGAYGAFPLLDLERKYGVFIVIEVSSEVGGQLAAAAKPSLDAIFDDANL